METRWTSFEEEGLVRRHRLIKVEVAIQLVETGHGGEIGWSHESRRL